MLAQCLMHRDVGLAKKLAIKMGLEDDEAMMDLIKSFEIMQSPDDSDHSDKYIQFDILQHYLTFCEFNDNVFSNLKNAGAEVTQTHLDLAIEANSQNPPLHMAIRLG